MGGELMKEIRFIKALLTFISKTNFALMHLQSQGGNKRA